MFFFLTFFLFFSSSLNKERENRQLRRFERENRQLRRFTPRTR